MNVAVINAYMPRGCFRTVYKALVERECSMFVSRSYLAIIFLAQREMLQRPSDSRARLNGAVNIFCNLHESRLILTP